jgi:hypothetical protein
MLEGAGQGDATLLSSGKFIGKGIPAFSHPQTGEKFLGTRVGLMLGFAGKQPWQGGIIQGGESGKKRVGLEHEAYSAGAELGEFSWRKLEEVRSLKVECALVGSGECSQEGHQGGFSRTGTTTDGDEFTRLDF